MAIFPVLNGRLKYFSFYLNLVPAIFLQYNGIHVNVVFYRLSQIFSTELMVICEKLNTTMHRVTTCTRTCRNTLSKFSGKQDVWRRYGVVSSFLKVHNEECKDSYGWVGQSNVYPMSLYAQLPVK